jgi:hypothetical protein
VALFNRIKSWATGEVLTATDLNAEFNNLLAGFTPGKIDGLSTPTSAMQTTVSPGSTGSESPAGDLGGEITRLRYVLQHIKGVANWYTPVLDSQTIPAEISLTSLKTQLDGILGNLMPPGMISPYGGSTAPTNWLLCDGSAYARTGTYANLFTAIGTSFGSGDNSTTFNVPDLRGMFLRGSIGALETVGSGTVSGSNYYATFTAHGLRTGMRVQMIGGAIGTTSFAGGLNLFFVRVIDANTVQFYPSPAAATNIGSTAGLIPFTGANTADMRQAQDPDVAQHFRQAPGGNATGVGSGQGDAISDHTHTTSAVSSGTSNSIYNATGATTAVTSLNTGFLQSGSVILTNAGAPVSGGGVAFENRPLSTTVNYIIRY